MMQILQILSLTVDFYMSISVSEKKAPNACKAIDFISLTSVHFVIRYKSIQVLYLYGTGLYRYSTAVRTYSGRFIYKCTSRVCGGGKQGTVNVYRQCQKHKKAWNVWWQ